MYDVNLIINFNTKEITMNNLQTIIENYLEYCSTQKRLDEKTHQDYNS